MRAWIAQRTIPSHVTMCACAADSAIGLHHPMITTSAFSTVIFPSPVGARCAHQAEARQQTMGTALAARTIQCHPAMLASTALHAPWPQTSMWAAVAFRAIATEPAMRARTALHTGRAQTRMRAAVALQACTLCQAVATATADTATLLESSVVAGAAC
mmetsp:Transcript_30505/g.55892  ORF Transcript_30505/g.55892 Transcript_30505/m.55892 type:complete len:158 (-) Transcript_30505:1346-1819(-)